MRRVRLRQAVIEIIVIVGLPGSGKTHLAMSLADQNSTVIDDFNRDLSRVAQFEARPTPKLIITDPLLCKINRDTAYRKLSQWFSAIDAGDATVEFISFENDPAACWKNIQMRDDGRLIGKHFVYQISGFYDKTDWPKEHPVYRP